MPTREGAMPSMLRETMNGGYLSQDENGAAVLSYPHLQAIRRCSWCWPRQSCLCERNHDLEYRLYPYIAAFFITLPLFPFLKKCRRGSHHTGNSTLMFGTLWSKKCEHPIHAWIGVKVEPVVREHSFNKTDTPRLIEILPADFVQRKPIFFTRVYTFRLIYNRLSDNSNAVKFTILEWSMWNEGTCMTLCQVYETLANESLALAGVKALYDLQVWTTPLHLCNNLFR